MSTIDPQENRARSASADKAAPKPRVQLSLPSDREIVISRDFAVRRELMFEVWTKPEHVLRWYGCETMTFSTCEMDFRVGGKYRFILKDAAGHEHAFSGEYREIMRPSRIVYTERYEAVPESDHLVTLSFEANGDGTRYTELLSYPSREHRDGHLSSGMEQGLPEIFSRVEKLALSLGSAI